MFAIVYWQTDIYFKKRFLSTYSFIGMHVWAAGPEHKVKSECALGEVQEKYQGISEDRGLTFCNRDL